MAVALFDANNASYDGNILTANGAYRMEAGNLNAIATTLTLTSSFQTFDVTFSNAGNLQGIVLIPFNSGSTKDITVKLQENVASVWTDRTSKTLTANEIIGGNSATADGTNINGSGNIRAFRFTPYAVDTTASKWRFAVAQSVTGSNNWALGSYAANLPAFAAWCDNKITYTSNTDQFVAVDTTYLNGACTLKGALQGADTVYSISGWICDGTTRDPATCSKLMWSPVPATSYQVDVSGLILMGSAGGFRAGTSTVPIPKAQMGNLNFITPAAGTAVPARNSTFAGRTFTTVATGKNFFIYGQIPTYERTTLSADALSGQPAITTTNAVDWVAGDLVVIGGQTTKGDADSAVYTVSSVVGNTVTFTGNLASARTAIVGEDRNGNNIYASVVRLNGYGFKLSSTNSTGTYIMIGGVQNAYVSGCEMKDVYFDMTGSSLRNQSHGLDTIQKITHSSVRISTTGITSIFCGASPTSGAGMTPGLLGLTFDYCNFHRVGLMNSLFVGNGQGVFTVDNNWFINMSVYGGANTIGAGRWTYTNNKHENSTTYQLSATGWKCILTDNLFWGQSLGATSNNSGLRLTGFHLAISLGYNSYNNNTAAFAVGSSPSFKSKSYGDNFGTKVANTGDIWGYAYALSELEMEYPKGNVTYGQATTVLAGYDFRLTTNNRVTGADTVYRAEGTFYKAGTGLSDTTKHVGTYCIKAVPLQSFADVLTWEQKVPTENIQNKAMSIGVWINIASASYWAGTKQMPRLVVNYDNGTTVYGEAAQVIGWQYVFVSFTPVTTYGELTVSVTSKTDASAANAIFYIADMSVLYPAGHSIALGAMNTWASSLPVSPSISTVANAADVWALDPANVGAGTIGKTVVKTEIKADDAAIIKSLI